jgi:hypothetical protein
MRTYEVLAAGKIPRNGLLLEISLPINLFGFDYLFALLSLPKKRSNQATVRSSASI